MFSAAIVVVCALGAIVLGVQSAQAEPKPETPPSRSVNSPNPSPTPASTSSSGAAASTSTTAPASSSGASNSISSASTVVGTTATVHTSSPASSGSTAPRQSYAPRGAHSAPPKPKSDRAPPKLGRLFELRVFAGLRELPSVASPDSSGWLLAAGFVLVLLVVAETSFLGLAGSRFGVGGDRSAGRRPPAQESLAIRQVQLRR